MKIEHGIPNILQYIVKHLPYKVKTQHVQSSDIVDTSLKCQISG